MYLSLSKDMRNSIGRQLGVLLADCEAKLLRGEATVETVQMIASISEIYRNFSVSELPGFCADFLATYSQSLDANLSRRQSSPNDRALLGDYLDPDPK